MMTITVHELLKIIVASGCGMDDSVYVSYEEELDNPICVKRVSLVDGELTLILDVEVIY